MLTSLHFTHAHTHAHTHAQKHMHMRTHTHAHIRAHTHTLTHSHGHAHSHARTHMHTPAHTRVHTHKHAHECTHTHTFVNDCICTHRQEMSMGGVKEKSGKGKNGSPFDQAYNCARIRGTLHAWSVHSVGASILRSYSCLVCKSMFTGFFATLLGKLESHVMYNS